MYGDPLGALLPFGGHKGYALAVVAELLAGAMSGGPTIQPGNERRGGTVNNMFTIIVDPARLAGLDWFRREIDGFVDYVKASPPADAAAPVLVPGDPERLAREERGRDRHRRRRDDLGRGPRGRREGRPAARLSPRGDQALISS